MIGHHHERAVLRYQFATIDLDLAAKFFEILVAPTLDEPRGNSIDLILPAKNTEEPEYGCNKSVGQNAQVGFDEF